jgi:hypothetical protein
VGQGGTETGKLMKKWIAIPILALVATLVPLASTAQAWPIGQEGCTPGYWKNHPESWQRFSPDTTLGEFFTFPAELSDFADDTFLEALNYMGGDDLAGKTEILLRAAVAAVLNMSHHDVNYPYRPYSQPGNVRAIVNNALASLNEAKIINVAARLDAANNLGCPL